MTFPLPTARPLASEPLVSGLAAALSLQAMKRLVVAVQELSLARDLQTVMAVVRSVARELTHADGASFVLRDQDQCFYADEDAIAPLWKGKRFPIAYFRIMRYT